MANQSIVRTLKQLTETSSFEVRSKILFILIGILLGMFIISTIVLTVLLARAKTTKSADVNNDLCLNPYCIKAANYLVDSLDQSVEPCEDFYQFVCGTWIKNNRIPDDAGLQNTLRILDTKLNENIVDLLSATSMNEIDKLQSIINARILYSSCIDETEIDIGGIDPVLSLMNTKFGGWPILQGSSWNSSMFNLTNLLLKLRQYSYNIIFQIHSDIDEKNSSATNIKIGQGSLGLPQRQYYTNETNINIAYRQFMLNLAKALTNDTSMIDQDVKEIYEFEKNISKYYWTYDEQHSRHDETIRTTISNLSRTLNTSFNFTAYVHHAYLFGNVTLKDMDPVAISELDFLIQTSSIINKTSPRILQNYFIWRFMMDQAEYMPRYIRKIKEQFNKIFYGTHVEQARRIKCGAYVNDNMGFVVSKLYIKKYFDQNARNESLKMIENILNSFINIINQSLWMDNISKVKAIEKAKTIGKQIGYPDYLGSNNNTKLENDYAAYVFNSSYIHNIFKILQIKAIENFRFLRKPVERKVWGNLPPTVINAFYEPSQNQITFPAGIFQMPFFDKDAPKYLNYGGIGMIIGHEITHGFDDTGCEFDKDGNRIPWWSDQTIEKFNDHKQCFIEQYSNFTLSQIHMNINGNQTQGEDIADNGGIKAAFYAYQNWAKTNVNMDKKLPGLTKYSPEQLFFINFAQTWCIKMTDSYALHQIFNSVHSPVQFRVIGPTSNFDEFDRVFGCKPGQGNSRNTGLVNGSFNTDRRWIVTENRLFIRSTFSLNDTSVKVNIQYNCSVSDYCDLEFLREILSSNWSTIQVQPIREKLVSRLYNPNNTDPIECLSNNNNSCLQNESLCLVKYYYWENDKDVVVFGACQNINNSPIVQWSQLYEPYGIGKSLTESGLYYCNTPTCGYNTSAIETFQMLSSEYILPVNLSVINATTSPSPTRTFPSTITSTSTLTESALTTTSNDAPCLLVHFFNTLIISFLITKYFWIF
ncbi:unnamed protein product [Rotaria sordida]|uniref:Uncharacterized protein n=2 Tax=Rotaria sordida TaxID=392033 RepID=A0A814A990_9BILA|nr:unnamed protein product [Rotaria sordida]